MESILSDTNKFKPLNDDPIKTTFKRESTVRRFLRKLNKSKVISNELFSKLAPTGSRPGILYGLPKVHKPNIPLRPIVSSINSHSFNIAKFLVPLLRPISVSQYSINDAFSFLQELFEQKFNNNVVMASFDVTSLFTNIPLDETIKIIADQLFSNSNNFEGFSRDEFVKLLNLAVKNCHFIFNGKFYDQIDGVAMGSPLGPLLANIFLSFHKTNWLKDCPFEFKPLYYRRYVDDSFIVFKSRDHTLPFLNYLNSKHTNITFTYEVEKDKCLPFLDVNILFSNGKFSTTVYRKPTFTGLFTNFESFIPITYKRGLINTLLFRYFNISSSYAIFHAEIEKFRQIMTKNGYPEKFFDKVVRSFLNKIFEKAPTELIAPKRLVIFSLPYTGLHSIQIRKQIINCFPLPIRIFNYGVFFDRYKDCHLFFDLKIAFLLV